MMGAPVVDPGIGVPDLVAAPPEDDPDTDYTPDPFPGEEVNPEWPGDSAMAAPAAAEDA